MPASGRGLAPLAAPARAWSCSPRCFPAASPWPPSASRSPRAAAALPSCSSESAKHGLHIAGSVPERPPGADRPSNTLLLAGPDGMLARYRKIHPFTFAGEDRHYAAGDRHVTVMLEGLRLTLFVCYDLRFANEFWATAPATDAYLVVANWPERRRHHWTALLQARAIENQAYVVGVNRVGEGDGLVYQGDSRVVDPGGEIIASAASRETLILADLDPAVVAHARESLPFLRDRRP